MPKQGLRVHDYDSLVNVALEPDDSSQNYYIADEEEEESSECDYPSTDEETQTEQTESDVEDW